MEPKESYEERLEMARMHDEYIHKLNLAIDDKHYVEASWLCYSIFEQRINRLIAKFIQCCPLQFQKPQKTAAISTRIDCIISLIDQGYPPLQEYDRSLLDEISKWCENRNDNVHDLVNINKYKKYDEIFESLAKEGIILVQRLYSENGKFRDKYIHSQCFEPFPNGKNCKRKYRCIK